MSYGLIFALFTFLFIVAITPGPNNLLFTSSGAQYGLRRSIPLMFGVILGSRVFYLFLLLALLFFYCFRRCYKL